MAQIVLIDTAVGPARAVVEGGGDRGLVVLGHGAGGGLGAPDLVAVTAALTDRGWLVAGVEQPYRVAGRRAPAPAGQLDTAWTAAVEALRAGRPGPLVTGGRSSGGRVACRTAAAVGADAVMCLAFPLRPPRRPETSRLAELAAVEVPTLVVQGERDPFGGAEELRAAGLPPTVRVSAVPGDHALRSAAAVRAAVTEWIVALEQDQRLA